MEAEEFSCKFKFHTRTKDLLELVLCILVRIWYQLLSHDIWFQEGKDSKIAYCNLIAISYHLLFYCNEAESFTFII